MERTSYDYSLAWEGEPETVVRHADAVIRFLPSRPYGAAAIVQWIHLDPTAADTRIEEIEREAAASGGPVRWTFGDQPSPDDLADRLEARGLRRTIHWDGLALRDLSQEFPANPEVQVELLSQDNVAEWATARAPEDSVRRAARLEAAHRLLATGSQDVQHYLGRIDGQVASIAVLRIESNGVAYLRNAITLPRFRGRGLYLALVAHRLTVARAAGCSAAVVAAQVQSSSPILRKRGFERVCGFYAYGRTAEEP